MEYFLMGTGIIIMIIALSYFLAMRKNKPAAPKKKGPALTCCPLCGSGLPKGENIYSKVYRPMNVPDQRCTVSGCPHCYPVCETGVRRECPCCHKKVDSDGYLVARLFNKTQGKKHVMIVGCNKCLPGSL